MQSMRYGLWIHLSSQLKQKESMVSSRLTASSGCPLSLKIYGSFQPLTSVFFAFSVWVVCYTLTWRIWLQKVSLIVPLSFRILMWGDSKVLLLQSPFLCGVFKCCPPVSACLSNSNSSPMSVQNSTAMVGKSLKGLENIHSKVQLSI